MFIELGVPLICSECDAEETSRWAGGKADPNKPVCKICYERQVRRASHSLASIACILSALPVFVTDAYVMFLHSSPPPAATAPAAGSPVQTRARCSSRGSRTASGSARSAGAKKRPSTASAPRARRAWTRCRLGPSRSASRARRGSATRATSVRCAHRGSSHPFTRTRTRDVLRHGSALAHRATFAFPVLRSTPKSSPRRGRRASCAGRARPAPGATRRTCPGARFAPNAPCASCARTTPPARSRRSERSRSLLPFASLSPFATFVRRCAFFARRRALFAKRLRRLRRHRRHRHDRR